MKLFDVEALNTNIYNNTKDGNDIFDLMKLFDVGALSRKRYNEMEKEEKKRTK